MIFSIVTTPVNPRGVLPLTRDEVWAGLVLQARDARPFLPGICTKCHVTALGRGFLLRESVTLGDDITEIVSFVKDRKVSFHQIGGTREGVIVHEILEQPGELSLRFYALIALIDVAPGSDRERREKEFFDSDIGFKKAQRTILEHIRMLSAEGAL